MNVTEKQKQTMTNFMCTHADFGRERLRYNRENKKRFDKLWEELTLQINSAGNSPPKSPIEWAKIISKVHCCTENAQEHNTLEVTSKMTTPIRTKRRLSNDADTYGTNTKRQHVKHVFQQHTPEYLDVQQQKLQLEEEKLDLAKEKFELKKKAHREQTKVLRKLTQKVTELTEAIQNIAPQYLE